MGREPWPAPRIGRTFDVAPWQANSREGTPTRGRCVKGRAVALAAIAPCGGGVRLGTRFGMA